VVTDEEGKYLELVEANKSVEGESSTGEGATKLGERRRKRQRGN